MKKNRSLKILGMSLLGAALLTACGSNNNGSSGEGTAGGKGVSLSINYYSGAISDLAIDAAKKEFPDYQLDFKKVPANEDYDTKLKASLNSKSAPDITAINSNIQDFLPYSDKFVNLLDYGTEELKDQYVEWKWDSTFTQDKETQMAMPIDIGPTALFYNVEAFEKAGLPTDPDEVAEVIHSRESYMEAAKQLKEKADMPMFQSANEILNEQIRTMTSRIYDPNGELTFADGQLKEVWDWVVEAQNNGYILGLKANTVDGVNATQQGLYGSMIKASWGIFDLEESGVSPGQYLITKAPGNASNYGGSYLAVLKQTEHPEEAAEVIKFLTNEANQRLNYEELSLFPANVKVYDDAFLNTTHELFGDEKFNKYFIESANELQYVPEDPRESTARSYFSDQILLVAEQGKDPEKAWNDAVKKVEEME